MLAFGRLRMVSLDHCLSIRDGICAFPFLLLHDPRGEAEGE